MLVEIPDDIAGRLEALAKRNDRGIEDVLRDMLMLHDAALEVAEGRKYATAADLARNAEEFAKAIERDELEETKGTDCQDSQQRATLADLARHAKLMNLASPKPVNTAGRSREILNTEFADYLQSRIDN